jgi:hypothetical protein
VCAAVCIRTPVTGEVDTVAATVGGKGRSARRGSHETAVRAAVFAIDVNYMLVAGRLSPIRGRVDHVLGDAEWTLVRTDDSDLAEDEVA